MTNRTHQQKLAALLVCALGGTAFGVEHATLDVIQRNTTNNNQTTADPAVEVYTGLGASKNFSVVGHNKGDIDVSFTETRANDRTLGVVINSIAELARQNGVLPNKGGPATTVYPNGVAYGTAGAEPSGTGYYLSNNTANGGAEPINAELNIDVAAAWFPHAEGWLAGHYKSAATLYTSSAIRLGKEFVRDGTGVSVVDLRHLHSHGVAATSQNGVLLVSGGDNAGVMAMARPNADGTFSVSTKLNSTNPTAVFNDNGVAFVYVPAAAAGMGQVMAVGKVRSDGSTAIAGGDFSVTKLATGRWLVKVGPEGSEFTNEDGTLVVSAEGGSPAPGTTPTPKNVNNFVAHGWSAADGGWIVESRDNIAAELEDGATPTEEMFSFVFLTPGDPENLFGYENAALPEVALSSPVENSYHTVGEPVTLATTVDTTEDVEIAKVDFYVDGELVGSATNAPYEFPWSVEGTGAHLVEAFAYTTDGAVAGAKRVWFYGTVPVGDVSIPGYSAAILDGGDLETDVTELDVDYVPSPTTPWNFLANSPGSQAFGAAGEVRGAPVVNIGGAPVPFNSGILFATNFMSDSFHDLTTRGSADNNVIAYNDGGNIALKVEDNKQGGSAVRPESGRFAMGFFPYSNGWVGATLAADGTFVGGSSNLPEGVKITKAGTSDFVIEGLPMTGNLLAVSQGAASDNVVCIGRSANTWIIRSVDNNGSAESDSTSFLYIPADTPQVLSGLVQNDGTLVPLNGTMAAHGARVTRTGVGYEIEFGDGSMINPSTAVLLVTADVNNGDGGDNVYAYHTRGNKFVVFSHDLPGINGFFQSGGFRFLAVPTAPLADPGQQVFVTHVVDKAQEGLEGDDTLTYRFSRLGGDPSQPLTVNYTMSGTATAGADYETPSGTVTFPAGVSEVEVPVVTLPDDTFEVRETVIVTLSEGPGFTIGSGSASGTIRNVGTNAAIQTTSFQQGVNGYNSYFGKRVGTGSINQVDSPSVQTYGVDGSTDKTTDINGILRFDNIFGTGAGQIPYGSTIVKAELTIATGTASSDSSGGPWVIDRLKGVVTSVTTYANLTNGSNAGVRGRSALTPLAGFSSLALGDIDTVDVTKFVRIWVNVQNNESEDYNHGFSLYDAATDDAWGYCTSGHSDPNLRPKLSVSYIPPSPDVETHAYSFDASKAVKLRGTVESLDGMTLQENYIDLEPSPGTTEEALFQFPVAFGAGEQAIPADEDIVRAELILTTASGGNSISPGPIAVHRMLEDWALDSNFGYYGPEVGTELDIAEDKRGVGLGFNSITTFDVTEIARAWRSGAGQYGINVKPETTDGWQFYWPGTTGANAAKVPKLVIYTAKSVGTGGSGFDDWATANGIGGASQDFDGGDHDGIPALVEYALGLSPTASDTLPGLTTTGGNTVLRFLKGSTDPNLVYQIFSSGDLNEWTPETPTVNNATEISLDITPGAESSRFYRLSVTYQEP